MLMSSILKFENNVYTPGFCSKTMRVQQLRYDVSFYIGIIFGVDVYELYNKTRSILSSISDANEIFRTHATPYNRFI